MRKGSRAESHIYHTRAETQPSPLLHLSLVGKILPRQKDAFVPKDGKIKRPVCMICLVFETRLVSFSLIAISDTEG